MGIKIFMWRKRGRNLKKNSLSMSGIGEDCVCCMPSSTWEKEAFTCDSADSKGFNIHALNASKTALLEAEQVKAKAIMEIRRKIIV